MSKTGIRGRLLLGFSALAFVAGIVGVVQFAALNELSKTASYISESIVVGLTNTTKVFNSLKTIETNLLKAQINQKDPSKLEEIGLYLTEGRDDYEKYIAMLKSGQLSAKEIEVIEEAEKTYAVAKPNLNAIIDPMVGDAKKFSEEFPSEKVAAVEKDFNNLGSKLSLVSQAQNDEGYAWSVKGRETSRSAMIYVVCAIIGLVVTGLGLGFVLSSRINNDLTQGITSTEKSLSSFSKNADQILTASTSLYERVRLEAESIQSSASAIVEINSMIDKVDSEIKKSHEDANSCANESTRGRQVMDTMLMHIKNIGVVVQKLCDQLENSSRAIPEVVQEVMNIEAKTKVIDEIVFQTRLLSFNASIEAARAGEYGKGFAVVADEVGALAKLSGQAAVEINETLKNCLTKFGRLEDEMVTAASTLSKDASSAIKLANSSSEDSQKSLNTIGSSITNLQARIDQIVGAIQEQVKGSREIQQSLNHLESVAEANKSAAQESTKTAEEIRREATSAESALSALVNVVFGSGKRTSVEPEAIESSKIRSLFSKSNQTESGEQDSQNAA